MTAGPSPSSHPSIRCTRSRLTNCRATGASLEHSLKALPGHAAVRELLRAKLAEVLAEQESRVVIADAPAR